MATKVQGVDRLKRKLKALPDAARREIAKAMEQSAQEVVDLAKSLVPFKTGHLKASIGWSWHGAPEGSMTLGAVRTQGKGIGNLSIVIYAGDDRAFYGRWVEFGTRLQPARPFFFPAYRAVRKRVRSRVSRAISKSVKSAAAA